MTKPETDYLRRYLAGLPAPDIAKPEGRRQIGQDVVVYSYPTPADADTEHQIHFVRQSIDQAALRRGIDTIPQPGNIQDWRRRLTAEREANQELSRTFGERIQALEAELNRLRGREKRLREVESKNRRLATERDGLHQTQKRLQAQIADRDETLRGFLRQQATLAGQRDELWRTVGDLEEKQTTLRRDLEARDARLQASAEQEQALHRRIADLDAHLRELESGLRANRHEARELGQRLAQSKQEQQQALQDLRASQDATQRLQTDLQHRDRSIRGLNYRLEQGARDTDASRRRIEELTTRVGDLDAALGVQRRSAEEIRRSRLWRVMGPARWLGIRVKKGLGIAPRRHEPTPSVPETAVTETEDRGPLRILMVIHQFLPRHAAGSEIYTYRLAKALARRHSVHLVFTEARPELPPYQLHEGVFDGLPYTEIGHDHVIRDFPSGYRAPKMEAIFADLLERFRPDLVHFQHLHYFSLDCIHQVADRGIPSVYTLHDYMLLCPRDGKMLRADLQVCDRPVAETCARCLSPQYAVPPPQQGIDVESNPSQLAIPPPVVARRLEAVHRALERVDLCISPSRFLRQKFIDTGMVAPDRIIYSENGLDLTPFQGLERRPSESFRVGYIGTIADYKGVHILVEAMNRLRMTNRLECHIHGSLEYFPDYIARLQKRSMNPRTTFHGGYENREIGNILSTIDLLVVPSLWYENAPLTIQEANAAGVPLLASDLGGMQEFVQEYRNGFHFRVGDPDDLARQIENVVTYPELLEGLTPLPVKDVDTDGQQMEQRYRQLTTKTAARV